MTAEITMRDGLLERLAKGPIICAEGYLFELERRGYVQAGAFVPEAVLDHPEIVEQVHRDFVHAGSDVVEAFTYYAHREKLRLIGREHQLEQMNKGALAIARKVALDTGTLFAGDICNTNVLDPNDAASINACRAMFDRLSPASLARALKSSMASPGLFRGGRIDLDFSQSFSISLIRPGFSDGDGGDGSICCGAGP